MYRTGQRATFKPPAFLATSDQYPSRHDNDRSVPAPRRSGSTYGLRTSSSSSSSSSSPARMHPQQASSSASASASRDDEEYYVCTWRKPQARKHKTWDGDATLVVNRARGTAKLVCQESARELAFTSTLPPTSLTSGDELTIGSKEIEVDRRVSYREYASGIPDNHKPPQKKIKIEGLRPSAAPSSLMAAAPSSSFYSKPLPKPQRKVKSNGRLSPEVQRALDMEGQDQSDDFGGGPSSRHVAIQPRPHGLLNPGGKAQPRYDPKAPGAVVMTPPDAEHQKRYNRRHFPLVDVVVNPILGEALRPHQIEGVKFLYERVTGIKDINGNRGAILADEMGLGKTLQTISLIETLLRQSPYYTSTPSFIEKALVVCPLSLVKNWKREFRKWLGPTTIGVVAVDGAKGGKEAAQRFVTSKRDQVLIIGYEKLRTCIDILSTAQPPIGLIVCDEGHRLKSKDAKTTKVFDQLSTPRRVILTGTPIQNDLSELFAMIDFVCPGLLGPYNSFKQIFEDPILKSRVQHCSKAVRDLGQQRSTTLAEVASLIVLRRTADILDGYLLPKNEMVLFCAPTRLQLEIYRKVLKSTQVAALTSGHAAGSALPLITVLRQICDSPELLVKAAKDFKDGQGSVVANMTKDVLREVRHLMPSKRTSGDETLSGKLLALSRILTTVRRHSDDKVVLVSTFTSTLDVLEAFCKKSRYPYVRLDGQTKQDDRLNIVNSFNRSPAKTSFVFLLSTRAGGVGLNLIGANRLFLMEPEWNPALDQQAMARIHRDGQTKPCFIYRMMLSGTMDEKIFQRQVTKLGLSDTLMNAGKNAAGGKQRGGGAGASGKAGDSFSQEELRDIFTLHEDTPCLSHDLLVCSCGGRGTSTAGLQARGGSGGGKDAAKSDESDDDEEPLFSSFVPASQQQAVHKAEQGREAKFRLAGLADWRHVDTCRCGGGEGGAVADVNDEVLQSVIAQQKAAAVPASDRMGRNAAREASGSGSGACSPEGSLAKAAKASTGSPSLLDQLDLDVLEEDAQKWSAGEERSAHGDRSPEWRITAQEAGNVLYVFGKQSGLGEEGVGAIQEDEDSGEQSEGEGEGGGEGGGDEDGGGGGVGVDEGGRDPRGHAHAVVGEAQVFTESQSSDEVVARPATSAGSVSAVEDLESESE